MGEARPAVLRRSREHSGPVSDDGARARKEVSGSDTNWIREEGTEGAGGQAGERGRSEEWPGGQGGAG